MRKKKQDPPCPKCGSTDVKSMEDKTKVLSYAGHIPIYKKKFVCTACSFEYDGEDCWQ